MNGLGKRRYNVARLMLGIVAGLLPVGAHPLMSLALIPLGVAMSLGASLLDHAGTKYCEAPVRFGVYTKVASDQFAAVISSGWSVEWSSSWVVIITLSRLLCAFAIVRVSAFVCCVWVLRWPLGSVLVPREIGVRWDQLKSRMLDGVSSVRIATFSTLMAFLWCLLARHGEPSTLDMLNHSEFAHSYWLTLFVVCMISDCAYRVNRCLADSAASDTCKCGYERGALPICPECGRNRRFMALSIDERFHA